MEGVLQSALEMEKDGQHRITVATLDSPDAPWLKGYPLETAALGPAFGGYRFCPRLVPWLKERRSYYNAVIVNGLWQYSAFGTWLGMRGSDTPYFVFPHGMLDPWFKRRYPLKHLKKWLYWPWADYRVLRDARAVFFTSEEERRAAQKSFSLYRCREQVVGYGTASPQGDVSAKREAFYARFPEMRDRRILLFLGRLHEKKGCDLAIEAFGRLAKGTDGLIEESGYQLMMAGPCSDASYLRQLEQLASANCPSGSVTFPGMLTGDTKWGAFYAADAFILPSHQENFGISVVEALACGTPVLISDKVNIWREIDIAKAGLTDDDTLEGTVRLINRWQETPPSVQREMAESARKCFLDNFEAGRAAQRLLKAVQC